MAAQACLQRIPVISQRFQEQDHELRFTINLSLNIECETSKTKWPDNVANQFPLFPSTQYCAIESVTQVIHQYITFSVIRKCVLTP